MDAMGILWIFYDVSMVYLWDSYWIPIAFLWEFHDASLIFLWDYYGVPEGIL